MFSLGGRHMKDERHIDLFGRVCARANAIEVTDFKTVQCRHLFAYLAMHPDIDHPRDRLIRAIWPMHMDGSARNRLSVALYHVKKALDTIDPALADSITSRRSTVRLDSSAVTIDLQEFRRSVMEARAATTDAERRFLYERAVTFYRGPLIPDVSAEWTIARQTESSEMFQEATVWLAGRLHNDGMPDQAVSLLSRSLDVEPFSEGATEMLTNWYVQSGKYELAVSCAKRLRRALAVQGRAPSRPMLDRIDELNVILADRTKAVVFADETVVTVLACSGITARAFEQSVRGQGGRLSQDGKFGLFTNPLIALEAARAAMIDEPDSRAFLFTTILGPHDPIPSVATSGLKSTPGPGVFGSDCFACLARMRGIDVREDVTRGIRLWRVTM